MQTVTRAVGALVALVLSASVLTVVTSTAAVGTPAPPLRQARPAADRVVETVLRGERYAYRGEGWRVRRADGLPAWLHLRRGGLAGTPPRLGRWRIELDERGVRRQQGERRRTVLVVRAVRPRAAAGTVLVSRGIGGRPANAESRDVTVSGDGSTVVFSSRATNLVPGTEDQAGRLYVWDAATRRVSLLHPERWAQLQGISDDGRWVLVRLTAGLVLLDRTDGSGTLVATRTEGAALTGDGARVVFQDPPGTLPARLLEWTRATGATRTLVPDVGVRRFVGLSGDGRYAAFTGTSSSELLDTTSGAFRGIGRTGLEGGNALRVEVSDRGLLLSVRGTGLPAGGGSGGDPVGAVRETLLGGAVGPGRDNFGASLTASGSHVTVATPGRHLRVVDVATAARTSPFRSQPSGQETWASMSDDASTVAYVSDGHDLLRGTGRGVANVFMWVRTR